MKIFLVLAAMLVLAGCGETPTSPSQRNNAVEVNETIMSDGSLSGQFQMMRPGRGTTIRVGEEVMLWVDIPNPSQSLYLRLKRDIVNDPSDPLESGRGSSAFGGNGSRMSIRPGGIHSGMMGGIVNEAGSMKWLRFSGCFHSEMFGTCTVIDVVGYVRLDLMVVQ